MLQARYIDEVWGDDGDFCKAFEELNEQIKLTKNVSKKR